jgi:hypothetical protein
MDDSQLASPNLTDTLSRFSFQPYERRPNLKDIGYPSY